MKTKEKYQYTTEDRDATIENVLFIIMVIVINIFVCSL